MKGSTVGEAWASFERDVMATDAGPTQRKEMRIAFYGGAWAMLLLLLPRNSTESDDIGVTRIENLRRECLDFAVANQRGEI